MRKIDLLLIFVLLALAVIGVCLLFSLTLWVNAKTLLLLGTLLVYIPLYAFLASNARGKSGRSARMFLYGGFVLLILAATVWHTFAADMVSPQVSDAQKEALRYYQQIIVLLCSAIGGSSIFHGIRLFSEMTDPN